MAEKIAPFQPTAIDEIEPLVRTLNKSFVDQKTKSLDFRIKQLRKLYWAVTDNEALIKEALRLDLGKSVFESELTEVQWVKNDILFILNNLHKWTKDEAVPDVPLTLWIMGFKVKKEPVGTSLVIGAFNYPFMLALGPFLGALAAGCTAVVKPSEQSPNSAVVIAKLMSVLDQSCYACVQGAVPETTKLLDQSWDKIFYTGSPNVGKIIAKKAAETLTPTTLELGGRNPAIVTRNANIKQAARRLLWGKFMNAGQACISQNYHLVDRSVMPQLIKEMGETLKEFFPNGTETSPDYARIATDRAWQRLKQLLSTTSGKILFGGKMDEKTRFLELTVIEVNDIDDPLIAEEHFGPLIVLYPIDTLDEAIEIARKVDPTPLSAYVFGNDAESTKILEQVRSGGATVNDSLFHAAQRTPPFGGIKTSGNGAYRGKASFDTFTHRRTICKVPGWAEMFLKMRYPPYTDKNLKQLLATGSVGKPNFDRNGNTQNSILSYIFSPSMFAVLTLVTVAAGFKQYQNRQSKL